MIAEYDCQVCGTHVRRRRSPANVKSPPRFCSQRCNGAAKRGTGHGPTPNWSYECEQCGRACYVYRSPSAGAPRFCSVQCTGLAQRGDANPAWVGGPRLDRNNYVRVFIVGRGLLYEHRWVMECSIGRPLTSDEVVHHRDRDRANNAIENLLLLPDQATHMQLHALEDR